MIFVDARRVGNHNKMEEETIVRERMSKKMWRNSSGTSFSRKLNGVSIIIAQLMVS